MLVFEVLVDSDEAVAAYKKSLIDLAASPDIDCSVSLASSRYLRLPAVRSGSNYYEGEHSVRRFLAEVADGQVQSECH